jgi:hypothetical protein
VGWSGIAVLFNELASVCVLLVDGFVERVVVFNG